MPHRTILALALAMIGLSLSAYAQGINEGGGIPGGSHMIQPPPPPPVRPGMSPLAAPGVVAPPQMPSSLPGGALPAQNRADDLRTEQINRNALAERLGPNSREVRDLDDSLRQAEESRNLYQLSQTPEEAQMRLQQLDESMRQVRERRDQAEEAGSRNER